MPGETGSAPANVLRLVNVAEANGWVADVKHGQSDDGSVKSCGVRLQRDDVRAFGVWRDGRWFSGMVADGRPVPCKIGYRALVDLVQSDGDDQ